MSEDGDEEGDGNGFSPVMAIALGPTFGALLGMLGITVTDHIGPAIAIGAAIGLMFGAVIYALFGQHEEP
ncbi:hypothetical protein ER308_02000 [Egibacter rhizosphaerae]|uniref:Uncharacterized protein n=1 Tax=Egibacter rhizosphaerae TaxID=1670831 RepID=A0A411YB89_9ACTN|nr:hypothetical protein [Egibacter rhizosphaerae]QBI18459.1 hypothetical protein ER308_02000 [Egibacter rhizosphaerae]